MSRFELLYPLVRASEGGYSDHPADRGGKTQWGVTQATYDTYRRRLGLSMRHVGEMGEDECRAIYLDYWHRAQCDRYPPGLDYAVFDAAIHAGPSTARRLATDSGGDIREFMELRLRHLQRAQSWSVFERGWRARLARVQQEALRMTTSDRQGQDPVALLRELVKSVKSKGHPKVAEFFSAAGRPDLAGADYCAAAVCYALQAAGFSNPRVVAARQLLNYGTPVSSIDQARRGDIFVQWRNHPSRWEGHTGFIVEVTADAVKTVEGNVNRGRIAERTYTRSAFQERLLGLRRPVRASATKAPADDTYRVGSKGEGVRELQRRLRALQYPVGAIDGEYGEQTRRAVTLFQLEHDLEGERGVWRPEYNSVLDTAEPLLPHRLRTTCRDLERMGDRQTRTYTFWQRLMAFLGLGSVVGLSSEQVQSLPTFFSSLRAAIDPLISIWAWVTSHPWITLLALACTVWLVFRFLKSLRLSEYRHFDWQGPYDGSKK